MRDSTDSKNKESIYGTNVMKNIFSNFFKSFNIKSNKFALYVLIFFSLNGLFLVFTSHVNVDENFYIYGAKLVFQGFLPYTDFFFTQSPLILYLYGLPLLIFGNSLLMSRLITFGFTFFTVVFVIKLTKNLNFEWAGIFAVFALTIAWWILYNLVITKTYASTVFFIVLSLYLLTTQMKIIWKNTLSIVFMGLAGGLRLNISVLAVFLSFWLAVKEWDKISKKNLIINLIKYLFIAAIVLGVIYGPFFIIEYLESHSFNKIYYNLLGVHTNRNLTMNLTVGIFSSFSFIFNAMVLYGVISALIIFLPIYFYFAAIRKRNYKDIIKKYELILLIFLVQLAIWGVYAMLATLFYEYIVTSMPLTLMLIFIGLSKFFSSIKLNHPKNIFAQKKTQKIIYIGIFLLIPLSQITQINLYVISRFGSPPIERIMYNDLYQYQDISNIISITTPPWGYIITYNPALAIQSGRNLMPGYEMAYFSYHHFFEPMGLNSLACLYYHVINGQILYYELQSNYTIFAAITLGEAFFTFLSEQVDSPFFYGKNITNVLNASYSLIGIYPGFGQIDDIMFLYLRKS